MAGNISGSLQSLVSRESLRPGDFVDTGENRLIQGILGSPSEIPLVEIDLKNDQISGRFLCGLVDYIPRGVDNQSINKVFVY